MSETSQAALARLAKEGIEVVSILFDAVYRGRRRHPLLHRPLSP
jgi:hypothetical protein